MADPAPTTKPDTSTQKPAPLRPGAARPATVITELQTDTNTSLEVPLQGKAAAGSAVTTDRDAASLTIDTATGLPEGETAEKPTPEGAQERPADEQQQDQQEQPAAVAPAEPLPDWDPANAEVASQYEGRYFNPEGTLNLHALTVEYWGNAKDGKAGALHEGTYKYLQDALGVSKEAAQEIERGLVAQRQVEVSQFFQRVGGRKRYDAAVTWARKSYSDADKTRFNAAVTGADTAARDDAVDAMLARFDRANPGQRQFQQRRGPPAAMPHPSAP